MTNLGNFNNLDDEQNWTVAITNYQDFRKIVCEFIKAQHSYIKTDEDVENFIKESDESIVKAMFVENKKDFAEGRYVYSQAAAAAMNLD